ncbi:MAG TPA: pyrroline-5-carboxylate reductase dimerization domain-containing protein [Solirubrobacteraceae bacterium]|jgi:pyrroline-5-carboxylate reductase|nr:pyrroline-5-carboxylate reductase dimerization domain-containing protein [Solirubrobacteraceae bacterium]
MQIGLIGAGNMATALARGWGRPVLCTDVLPERARALAEETGGEALADGREVATRADLVVLCHKPAQLPEVAAALRDDARAIVSILGGVARAEVVEAYPGRPVYRLLPSTPVEVRQGVVLIARSEPQPLDADVAELFGELGLLVPIDEGLVDVAMGLMSTAPAFLALVAEAQVDAGVRHGMPAERAAELVVQTMAGTAALLRHRGYDTLAVRRQVTSPGGSTARGLDALERAGLRAAFSDALDAVSETGSWAR